MTVGNNALNNCGIGRKINNYYKYVRLHKTPQQFYIVVSVRETHVVFTFAKFSLNIFCEFVIVNT